MKPSFWDKIVWQPSSENFNTEKLCLNLIAGVVLVVVCVVRLRLLELPLERDEGEYAYMGQQILHGVLPYTETTGLKLPGIHFLYSLILVIFGQTPTGIHVALLFTNIATSYLLFLLGRRLFNESVGIVAGICFLVLTLSPSTHGFRANSEHFVMLPAIGGLLIMLKSLEEESRKQLLLSGILLGCAFLIKQHGILFFLFGFICVCFFYIKKLQTTLVDILFKIGIFVIGGLMPFIFVITIYLFTDNFDTFWFWTFTYPFEYVSALTFIQGLDNFKTNFAPIVRANPLVIMLSLLGIASVVWSKSIRLKYVFSFGLLVFSFLATIPGLYFRPHYFILLLPALSLFAGMGAGTVLNRYSSSWLKLTIPIGIVTISLGISFFLQKEILFKLSISEVARFVYGMNPFQESLEVAKYINKNTNKDDEIAILGSEPQIYFYAKRKSATRHVHMSFLMGGNKYAHHMQEEMISEIELSQPKYIIKVNVQMSWGREPDSSGLLATWMTNYIGERYEISGIVDIISRDTTIYKWGDQTKGYSPRSSFYLLIFKKKDLKRKYDPD